MLFVRASPCQSGNLSSGSTRVSRRPERYVLLTTETSSVAQHRHDQRGGRRELNGLTVDLAAQEQLVGSAKGPPVGGDLIGRLKRRGDSAGISKGGDFSPRGHLTVLRDILGCHNQELGGCCRHLVGRGQGHCLNTLKCTGRPPQQGVLLYT